MATKKTTAKKAVPAKKPVKKEVKHVTPDLIYRVLQGEYGAEGERNVKLTAEGYSPSAVTKKINDLTKIVSDLQAVKDKSGDYFGCLIAMLK